MSWKRGFQICLRDDSKATHNFYHGFDNLLWKVGWLLGLLCRAEFRLCSPADIRVSWSVVCGPVWGPISSAVSMTYFQPFPPSSLSFMDSGLLVLATCLLYSTWGFHTLSGGSILPQTSPDTLLSNLHPVIIFSMRSAQTRHVYWLDSQAYHPSPALVFS